MKTIKIIFLVLVVIMQSCFPNFRPNNSTLKEIKQGKIHITWIAVTGILDQNYPDYIIIQKNNLTDTLCISHNIADVTIQNSVITIGFYGTPKRYSKSIMIPDEVFGYKIEVDTTGDIPNLAIPK